MAEETHNGICGIDKIKHLQTGDGKTMAIGLASIAHVRES